jgi:hypothetical protein
MLSLGNVAGFTEGLDRWMEAVEEEANQALRGLAAYAFHRILWQTPQWYGTAAANWKIGVNKINEDYDSDLFRSTVKSSAEAKQKGHPEAITYALAYNSGILAGAKVGDTIFISNSLVSAPGEYKKPGGGINVTPGGEEYVWRLEWNRAGFLRPENEPGHMVEHAARDVADHFGVLSSASIRRLSTFIV